MYRFYLFAVVGFTELVIRISPPFPIPGFAPNFTGFDFNQNISWHEMYKAVAQKPENTLSMVGVVFFSHRPHVIMAITPCPEVVSNE